MSAAARGRSLSPLSRTSLALGRSSSAGCRDFCWIIQDPPLCCRMQSSRDFQRCSAVSYHILSFRISVLCHLASFFRDEGEGRRKPFLGVRGAAAAAANARGDWQRRRAPRLGGARRTIDNLNGINSSTTFAARICDTSGTKLLSGAAQQDGSQVTPESQSGSQVLALHNASCGASALWILKRLF